MTWQRCRSKPINYSYGQKLIRHPGSRNSARHTLIETNPFLLCLATTIGEHQMGNVKALTGSVVLSNIGTGLVKIRSLE